MEHLFPVALHGLSYVLAAHHLKEAILVALIHKLKTGGSPIPIPERSRRERDALNNIISACILQHTLNHWVGQFENIPFGIVKNMQDVFQDEKAKSLLLKETIEGVETVRVKTALV